MKLQFKTKILILVMTPLIILSLFLTVLSVKQAEQLGAQNIRSFESNIYSLRRNELKNYTELAYSAVDYIKQDASLSLPEAQKLAKAIYRNMSFGKDGYFFVYDYDGVNLVHPEQPQLEGKNNWSLQDSRGTYVIRTLISQARIGGGYTDYIWDKPSRKREVEKIGYSLGYDDWGWMIGTGLYVDDLEDAVTSVQQEVDDNIVATLQLITLFAVAFTVVVGFTGARFTITEGRLADQMLKDLSRKAVASQEDERGRVARNLQKSINQPLNLAKAKLQHIAKNKHASNYTDRKDLSAVMNLLNKTIQEVHRISGELRPEALDQFGLYPAVDKLIERVSQDTGLNIDFKKSNTDQRLPEDMESALYRVVQEAIKNTVKHAEASNINIRMRHSRNSISLNIQDNGKGFDTKEKSSGVGLSDMRVRIEALGGQFNLFSSKDIGTVIKVELKSL